MNSADPDALGQLLEQALALPPDERIALLDEVCEGVPGLREELVSLLDAHDPGAAYFERLSDNVVAPALLAVAGQNVAEHAEYVVGQTIAQYRLVELLGSGGMGVVFKAFDTRLDRYVALKFLPAFLSADTGAKRRLIAEAKAASALDHANIGVVHDIGETTTRRLFIVMGYYDGVTLQRRNRAGDLSVHEAIGIAEQIASALAAAHRKGIVHRDVKPSNILITSDGTAKLLDFGIAKLAGSRPGSLVTPATPAVETAAQGTIPYMSPEQTREDRVDHQTDVWSLGVVLYEMLTGVRPFRGETAADLVHAIRHESLEPIGRQNVNVPDVIIRVVERCLKKDPEQRYGTALEVLDDLRSARATDRQSGQGDAGHPKWRAWRRYGTAAVLVGVMLTSNFPAHRLPREVRLAVLPLTVEGSDPEATVLADGVTDELITQLSRFSGLRVISRSSVTKYRGSSKTSSDIGQELTVGTLLEGTLRRTGDRVQVVLRLLDAPSGAQLWSERYVQDLGSLQAGQRAIARAVALVLHVPLGVTDERSPSTSGTSNPEAYVLYLKGRQFLAKWDEPSARKAREHFQRAVDLDPTFAQAWTGLGDSYHVLSGLAVLPAADAYPRTRAAAERALQHQYAKALAALERAGEGGQLQVQQHVLRGYIYGLSGRRADVRKELDALERLSKEKRASPWHFAIVHLGLGEYERALDFLEEADRLRVWQLRLLPVEPMFDPIRSLPRFQALASRVR